MDTILFPCSHMSGLVDVTVEPLKNGHVRVKQTLPELCINYNDVLDYGKLRQDDNWNDACACAFEHGHLGGTYLVERTMTKFLCVFDSPYITPEFRTYLIEELAPQVKGSVTLAGHTSTGAVIFSLAHAPRKSQMWPYTYEAQSLLMKLVKLLPKSTAIRPMVYGGCYEHKMTPELIRLLAVTH